MSKQIPLTRGKFAIVDDDDFEWLNKWKWYCSDHGYAMTAKSPHRYMHRMINKTPKNMLTDHINRNTLDNRKINLRNADKRLNSINRNLQSNNTSGYKGISWNKHKRGWETYISEYGKRIRLGLFKELTNAIEARKQAERRYYAI